MTWQVFSPESTLQFSFQGFSGRNFEKQDVTVFSRNFNTMEEIFRDLLQALKKSKCISLSLQGYPKNDFSVWELQENWENAIV